MGAHPFAAGSPLDTAQAIAEGRRTATAAAPHTARPFTRLLDAMLDADPQKRPTADVAASRLEAIASATTKPLVKWAAIGGVVAASVARYIAHLSDTGS